MRLVFVYDTKDTYLEGWVPETKLFKKNHEDDSKNHVQRWLENFLKNAEAIAEKERQLRRTGYGSKEKI